MRSVLCFGDSNTHGTVPMTSITGSQRHPYAARWPTVMGQALGTDWQVIAEGHPGRTTVHDDPIEGRHKNGEGAFLALLESHRPLDLVLIMLGTNDLKHRYNVTAFEIAQGVEKLVGMARASTTGLNNQAPQILVVAPPPLRNTGVLMHLFQGGPAKSGQFGQAFSDMAARANVPVFDAGAACQMSQIEGVHMDEAGHQALGQALAKQVSELAG